MSFRRRLTLFFGLIVVVPMVGLAALLVEVSRTSTEARTDARLLQALTTGEAVVESARASGRRVLDRAAEDRALVAAISDGSGDTVRRRLEALTGRGSAIEARDADGRTLATVGGRPGPGAVLAELREADRTIGSVEVATRPPSAIVRETARLVGGDAALFQDGELLSSSTPEALPRAGDATVGGEEVRGAGILLPEPGARESELVVALSHEDVTGLVGAPVVVAGLAGFLGLALLFALALRRALASQIDQVAHQAITDELTGLANARRFREILDGELARARRFDHPVGLVLLDLDDFKEVNDTWGHLQGDEVLRAVARTLRAVSREVDEPARYGGEELAVVLPETDLEGAYRHAERVRRELEALRVPKVDGPGHLRVTASFGVAAAAGERVPEPEEMMSAADRALYKAKREGKNRTERAA